MADEKLSKELVLQIDGDVVAHCTDFGFSIDGESIDVSTFTSGDFKKKLAGDLDWSIDFSGLVTRDTPGASEANFDTLMGYMIANNRKYTCAIASTITADKYWEGDGILKGLSESASKGGSVTYSGSIEGAGPLTEQTVGA